jgi:hypothetical protein
MPSAEMNIVKRSRMFRAAAIFLIFSVIKDIAISYFVSSLGIRCTFCLWFGFLSLPPLYLLFADCVWVTRSRNRLNSSSVTNPTTFPVRTSSREYRQTGFPFSSASHNRNKYEE